jgi:hypothetical protein
MREEFKLLSALPAYYLDMSKGMDDRLPIGLSEGDFCRQAVREGRPVLLLVLAPLVIALRVFREPSGKLSREQRLDYVTFLFGFVLVTLLLKETDVSGALEKHAV